MDIQKTKRHPSTAASIFTTKQRADIIDLEKTSAQLESALAFIKKLGEEKKQFVIVGTKPEARDAVKKAGQALGMPHVFDRWIGGSLTNFHQTRKRIDIFEDLSKKQEKNELVYKTKKEKLMIEREIARLDRKFGGIANMKELPAAIFVIDSESESIAIDEADDMSIPVISLSNSDCNIKHIKYPIVANDASVSSIEYFIAKIVQAYKGN